MILIMYTKKSLYTLLHSMNGGFIFSSQTRAVFSLTFTFQVYGADLKKKKHKNILANVSMYRKQWSGCQWSLRVNKTQIPVNQRGPKPHTEANRKSHRLVWKNWMNPKRKKCTTLKYFILGS